MADSPNRIDELARKGAIDRQELASAVRVSAENARSAAARIAPVMKTAGAGLAAAGFGLTVAAVIRRIRARRRPHLAWKRIRRSLDEFNRRVQKHKPRPIPATLLLALVRSKTARRAIASAVQRAAQSRSASEPEAEREASDGPARAPRLREAEPASDDDSHARGPEGAKTPPPPVPKQEAKAAPIPKKFGIGVALFKAAYGGFRKDEAITRSAALAYYTVFSLAPLLVIAVAVAGFAFGHEAAQGRMLEEIRGMVGPEAAKTLQTLMQKAQKPSANVLATILGVATLLFGAAGVFGHLQESLNKIWNVPENPHGGLLKMIQDRFLSLAMVLGSGFLLLVSLVISAFVSAIGDRIRGDLSGALGFGLTGLNALLSWAIVGLVFGLIFRYLPDTRIAWKDVWIGAAITSLLFAIGQFAIGLYIGRTSVSSVYGGAASLAIILIWTYYSAAILFFGAEITQTYASWYGSKRE